jgi:hypothetical protein
MSLVLAHRDTLRRRAILIAFGVEADIEWQAGAAGLVAFDLTETLAANLLRRTVRHF